MDLSDKYLRFQCGDCGALYEVEDEARECCAPEIHECWLCPVCSKDHYDMDDAIGCCSFDPEKELVATPLELELHAGQMRFVD
ncbi:hypothetical protein [Acidihalobacter prosperus]|uniref:hypothetical protein n=1 Tax=Acidihalobacter prosperus TaxID=160660 RepID=UPI000506BAEF|nr:hypothetical protein [Acidihalobacter prosperus]